MKAQRQWKIWLVTALIALGILLMLWRAARWLEIGKCLDHGGSWDYERQVCSFADETASD